MYRHPLNKFTCFVDCVTSAQACFIFFSDHDSLGVERGKEGIKDKRGLEPEKKKLVAAETKPKGESKLSRSGGGMFQVFFFFFLVPK